MDGTIGIEELLNEAGWLRRLAASLVGNGAQADDLVQDTWVAALRHPPRADGEPRPWLARVARNLAGNARRERARREERERTPREEPPQPGPGSLAQEAEAQRLLAEAVTRLPEPLRAVIVLRYFQGLDSNAVAARLSVPASTVRTRLQRAIEELRADLDRRCEGGRKAWGLLLVPLLREAPSGAAVIGSWPLWLAGASAACALAVVGANSWATEDLREQSAARTIVALEAAEEVVAAQESIPLSSETRTARERVVGSFQAPAASAPVANEVSGILLVDGRPPEWPIQLALLPPARPSMPTVEASRIERLPRRELTVAPEQRGAFSFDGLSPTWSGRLSVDGYSFADGKSSIVLDAAVRGLLLELSSGSAIVGRIVSPDGVPVVGLQGEYQLFSGKGESKWPVEEHLEGFLARADGSFRIPLLTQSDWGTVTIRVEAEGLGYLQHKSERFVIATGLDLGDLALELLRPLEFTVRDPSGAPIADAIARVDGPGLGNRPPPMTRTDGSGVLAVMPDRPVKVRFGAAGHRDRVMTAESGNPLEVVLEPLAVFDVRLIGSTADRAASFRVSADRSAFVWDDDHWGKDDHNFRFEVRGDRPNRRTTPAAPGQRFEYEFSVGRGGSLQLIGLRTDLAITIEALDSQGVSLCARVVTVEAGKRAALDLGDNR